MKKLTYLILCLALISLACLGDPEQDDWLWCGRCTCWVAKKDLKIWSGDDMRHHLCPGCDADLLEPEIME